MNANMTERHEHGGAQCKPSDRGTICQEESCRRDHHVSEHIEVKCEPIEGQSGRYNCVHEMSKA